MNQLPIRPAQTVRWLTVLMTLLLAGALCLSCLVLYRAGTSAENLTPEGVRIQDIYTRENVGQMLAKLAPAAVIWVLLLIASAWMPKEAVRQSPKRPVHPKKVSGTQFPVNPVRILLAAAAMALIVAGVLNGGMYDVLVKAINICTECIGLG